ncbi:DUF815 domain-containing protein [Synechococcales cyanobacterium C]|uniref:DUF815 domain-containing protein n=1 Tax=Petrachloros mirabilis ULC683 TaxID=2781853 RepID=A0A8K2A975_9CYAN|nr:ATP-binding protein [Petrachloros mirabilis]NCJ07700.1 DUF815 domain-containing protein [Petrachloros mirabilis ULC683]
MSVIPLDEVIQLQYHAAALLIYAPVLAGSVGIAFQRLLSKLARVAWLSSPSARPVEETTAIAACLRAYGDWFYALAATQQSWRGYLVHQLAIAENPLTQYVQSCEGAQIPEEWLAAAQQDLTHLQALAQGEAKISEWMMILAVQGAGATWDGLRPVQVGAAHPLLAVFTDEATWAEQLPVLVEAYGQQGTGIVGQYLALRWQSGQLQGIRTPDPIRLVDLVGYERQQEALLANTEALLAGSRALNVLLYGSRGTGKSALIKALLWEYCDRGLRLIEIAKADLSQLPQIVEQVCDRTQKFILFVDDLSFEAEEDSYKALKVVLEGNLTARPQNVVVYATSNRRHLIREFFDERPRPSHADEIHAWDTVQEKLSLSDRFGLTLTFEPPDQPTYLQIVHHLACQSHLELATDALEFQALQWATRQNGRSGRTARQCIDYLLAQQRRNP